MLAIATALAAVAIAGALIGRQHPHPRQSRHRVEYAPNAQLGGPSAAAAETATGGRAQAAALEPAATESTVNQDDEIELAQNFRCSSGGEKRTQNFWI